MPPSRSSPSEAPAPKSPARQAPARESAPVTLEFPDATSRSGSAAELGREERSPGTSSWWSALLPLAFLGSIALGVALVLRGPAGMTGWIGGGALLVGVGWILTSILWPARADRSCPACGQVALERADPDSTHGLVCSACGWSDDHRSSWLLAEEEGPLEITVLRERGRLPQVERREMDKLPREH